MSKSETERDCREDLAKFRGDCDIITGDETWIFHRQVGHKVINAGWVTEGESATTTVAHRGRFEPKLLSLLFFKSNGPDIIPAVDKDMTADHNYDIKNYLKPVVKEIRKKRKLSGRKGIKLLQDNARPHTHSDIIN